ncbi:MAG: hypothetical protein LBV54_07465, partial [Puniceicoccales bacterium]|nr:hypothetical protein [Puniceicoccales bacterium]
KFDSFCYLGEAQCPNKLTVIIGRKSLVETIFSNTDGKSRFCFFLAGTGLSGEFFDHNRINSSYTKEIKIIMEDGREFIVRGGGNNYSLISFEIPREAGDAPIKAFVFKSYPELSRVVFNIPSLIDFFPENKGVKNWFNVRMPKGIKVKVNERNHFFFKNSIGIELDYLDHNFTKLSSYRPLVEGKEFDFSGKSYCEALIEYIQSHGNLSVENVAVNASKEFIYIKAPLWERLRDWCESPRLDRWPWTDSFSIP